MEKETTAGAITVAVELTKALSKEIYTDLLKPGAVSTGNAIGSVIGLFENVVLYPLNLANIQFKYKLECFKQDLESRILLIPKENIIQPPIEVVGPALESLRYTLDTEELREMYMNLIASCMSSETASEAHPAFVEIIKAMSGADAQLFLEIAQSDTASLVYSFPGFGGEHTTTGLARHILKGLPLFYIPHSKRDQFAESRSIQNLLRLGLLNDFQPGHYESYPPPYDALLSREIKRYSSERPQFDTSKVVLRSCYVEINDFGRSFAKICLPKSSLEI